MEHNSKIRGVKGFMQVLGFERNNGSVGYGRVCIGSGICSRGAMVMS